MVKSKIPCPPRPTSPPRLLMLPRKPDFPASAPHLHSEHGMTRYRLVVRGENEFGWSPQTG